MRLFVLMMALFIFTSKPIQAQKKVGQALKVSLDCAQLDNTIKKKYLSNCTTISILGDKSKAHKIVSCTISFFDNGNLKEFTVKGDKLPAELKGLLAHLDIDKKIYIENIKILNTKSKKTSELPKVTLVVKND